MCLITEQRKSETLKKDLTVYKAMNGYIESYSRFFSWELNKLYKQRILRSTSCISYADQFVYREYDTVFKNPRMNKLIEGLVAYGEGFHSSLTAKRIEHWGGDYIFKCLIPKGSKIYRDKTGLIVSNQIIIKKQLK